MLLSCPPRSCALEGPLARSLIVSIVLASSSLALLPATARAQEEVCSEVLTHESWNEAMNGVDEAFAAFDPDKASRILDRIKKHVPCLDAVVLPSHLGRYARQMAMAAFFEQDEITAVRWGLLQRYAAPDLPWPPDIGEDHPLRTMLEMADPPPLSGPEDAGLVFPKKGAVFMNGHLLEHPRARAEVPNLVQVFDKKGLIVEAYWQDGAAFREELVGPPRTVASAPKWFVPEDPSTYADAGSLFGEVPGGDAVAGEDDPGTEGDDPTADAAEDPTTDGEPAGDPDGDGASDADGADTVAVTPPPRPAPRPVRSGPALPQLIAGGGLGIIAGSLYAVGAASRGGLEKATTEEELIAARSRVNAMVFGAGAAAAAGVGVGVTAFVSAEGGGLGWRTRF